MTITTDDWAKALYLALQEVRDEDHDRVIDNVISELRESGRLSEFEEIIALLEEMIAQDAGRLLPDTLFQKTTIVQKQVMDELNDIKNLGE